MTKALTVRLPEDVYRQVKSEALTTGRSINSLITDAAAKINQDRPNTNIYINTLNNFNGPVNYNREPSSQNHYPNIFDVPNND